MAYALEFTTSLSFARLLQRLNEVGPWHWRGSDSDSYGQSLWCVTEEGYDLQIFGPTRSRWIVQVGVPLRNIGAQAAMDRLLLERILPAIEARDIEPSDTVR